MADVEVTYRGQIIRSMSASGTEVLHTGGKLCDDDITIDYTSPGGGGANLQTKSVSYTPDETGISDTVLPDPGYDGLDEVDVTVTAIPDTYIGSAVPQKTAADLVVNGPTVSVPPGVYAVPASKTVQSGTAGTPTASKGAISNHSVDVTPSVTNTTGYITGSTITGTPITVSASELVSGSQTITANGTYDVTDLAEAVVNVSGGGALEITTVTNTNMNICGNPVKGINTINVIAGSAAGAKYCSRFNCWAGVFENLVEITYSGMTAVHSTSPTTELYRDAINIKSVDFGGVALPASVTRFFTTAENCNSSTWIEHTTHIEGLIWDNVTTMTNCFTSTTSYAVCLAHNQYFDIDFGNSEISGDLNFAPNATNYFPFTHATLISLIDCLKSGVSGTVKIGLENLNSLSAAEIAVATAKGWTVTA